MKVIMLEDDEVREVKEGFARNYLLPKKLAVLAAPAAIAQMDKRKQKKASEAVQHEDEAKLLASKISSVLVTISVDAGEKDKLFGSIGAREIADAIKDQHGIEVDRKKIVLYEPIKILGDYKIQVKLFHQTQAEINLSVVKK